MRTRNKRRFQHVSQQTQNFPNLFLTISREQEETVRVTEQRYELSATGKSKEEALEAFWLMIDTEMLESREKMHHMDEKLDEDELTQSDDPLGYIALKTREEYFCGIMLQERAFKRRYPCQHVLDEDENGDILCTVMGSNECGECHKRYCNAHFNEFMGLCDVDSEVVAAQLI